MELALIAIAAIGGGIGGFALCHYINRHDIAAGVARVVTLPQGTIDALNAKIDGLGNQVKTANADLTQHVTDTVAAAQATVTKA